MGVDINPSHQENDIPGEGPGMGPTVNPTQLLRMRAEINRLDDMAKDKTSFLDANRSTLTLRERAEATAGLADIQAKISQLRAGIAEGMAKFPQEYSQILKDLKYDYPSLKRIGE